MTSISNALTAAAGDGSGIDESSERAGQQRHRQRDHHPPQREVRPHDRQFPGDRPAIADQGPAHHHGDGGAEIGADREQRARHRIGGERPTRQNRAERSADQQSLQSGLRPHRSRHFFVWQDLRDEGAEQAAGQHPRQDAAEQSEVVLQDFPHPMGAVAPPDQRSADCD
jgi:hypothetical protein